jgi:aldehyde:ferredoxin oxidoreductase
MPIIGVNIARVKAILVKEQGLSVSSILRINLTTLTATQAEATGDYRRLGGRAITASVLNHEVPPSCDPLGEENKLIWAPGLMGGSIAPCSGRLSVGAKSPMTRGIKEANTGGAMGQKLARLGLKAVIFEGKAKEPTVVRIDEAGVSFASARPLSGLGCYEILEQLKSDDGNNICIGCIGPAGDMGLTASGIIFTTPDFQIRLAARGGLGAVMGSKNLKAVVVDDAESNLVEVKDLAKLEEKVAVLTEAVLTSPSLEGLRRQGTSHITMLTQIAGALPTKNFSRGQFDQAGKISGDSMEKLLKMRANAKSGLPCMDSCIIRCSNIFTDEAGKFVVGSMEYESIALIGSNCLIGDLDAIARIVRACNHAGVDTMDVGAALAVAMEGGLLPWGDGAGALRLVEEIMQGTENGRMIGCGAKYTGEKLGVQRVPHVKGQAMSGYDPRVLKGTGVTYATSPTGADHTAGMVLPGGRDPQYDPDAAQGQARESRFMQQWMAAIDSLGFCMMLGMVPIEDQTKKLDRTMIDCLSAITGEEYGDSYLMELGEAVLAMERAFNKAAGLTKQDDRLPKFFSHEKLGPGQAAFDVPEEELDSVHIQESDL